MKDFKKLKQKGLTLVELVIVLIIVGILAAVGVAQFVDLTSSANSATKSGNGGAASTALLTFIASSATNAYPTVATLAPYVTVTNGTVTAPASGDNNGKLVVAGGGHTYTIDTLGPGAAASCLLAAQGSGFTTNVASTSTVCAVGSVNGS